MLENNGSIINSRRADTYDYWYRQDIRGSVTNIVDVDDDVVRSYTYDAYGNTDSTGAFVNSFAYTGAVVDEETDLYYMNARYYDPATGRFISEDSYRGDGEAFWHLYVYCDGDPVNNTDPSGHFVLVIAGVSLGVAALIAIGIGIGLIIDYLSNGRNSLLGKAAAGLSTLVKSVSSAISYAKTKAIQKYKDYKKSGYENHHIIPKGGGAATAYRIYKTYLKRSINLSENYSKDKVCFPSIFKQLSI